jgi:hypothetical protein
VDAVVWGIAVVVVISTADYVRRGFAQLGGAAASSDGR